MDKVRCTINIVLPNKHSLTAIGRSEIIFYGYFKVKYVHVVIQFIFEYLSTFIHS